LNYLCCQPGLLFLHHLCYQPELIVFLNYLCYQPELLFFNGLCYQSQRIPPNFPKTQRHFAKIKLALRVFFGGGAFTIGQQRSAPKERQLAW
jgi:hypothetical protein